MICKTIALWDKTDNPAYIQTFLLENSKELNAGKKKPIVIICPGGAYLGTSDREAEAVALRFNTKGYHAIVLRYNTYFGDFNFSDINDMVVKPRCLWPSPLYDLAKTMLVIHEQAQEWFVDTAQISLCGFSAGGNLVGNMATRWHEPWLAQYLNTTSDRLKPKSAILGYPVTDYFVLNELMASRGDTDSQNLFNMANITSFGTLTPTDEQLASISPTKAVTSNTVPTFIWHTANDGLVYAQNALVLAMALANHNIPYELHVYKEGVHGLSLCDATTANEPAHINPACANWFEMAITFIESF